MREQKYPAADPRQQDAHADWITFLWLALFMGGAMTVTILSSATELERADSTFPIGKLVFYEITGFGALLCLYPLITQLTTIATPGQHAWRWTIPVHIGGTILVAVLHITLFLMARKIMSPLLFAETYIFTDNWPRELLYEYRKSAFGYGAFLAAITFGRELTQQRREIQAAREDARTTQRLTLKCGGRTIFLNADDFLWAKAASNYVEIYTATDMILARSTLIAIERQISDADLPVARVHRSYLINKNHIRKIEPTGEGDIKIEMDNGAVVPGSRRYRDQLTNTLAEKEVKP